MHRDGIEQMAEDLREHMDIELYKLDKKLYEMHSLHPAQGKSTVTETISTPVVTPEIQPRHEMAVKPEAATPQPEEEKSEIEPRRPDYSEGVQLSLLDLWGMTEEVRKQEAPAKKKKTAKKESPASVCLPNRRRRLRRRLRLHRHSRLLHTDGEEGQP